jgi:hypothetical protein
LLAATEKSGQLEVGAPAGGGELLLHRGGIVSGAVSTAPHATEPSEVLFELLRLDDGSFAFHEGDQAEAPTTDVEEAVRDAEQLVAEWAEVETVVPSMRAWVTLVPELDGDGVEIDAAQWRLLAAVGGGGNVRDLAATLELSDLAACRAVKELADGHLVDVRATHGHSPMDDEPVGPSYELTNFEEFEQYEAGDIEAATELEHLTADDRPVIMEDRDDALLPEPLPSEGVAYEGELIGGTVDGRAFDPIDHGSGDASVTELVQPDPMGADASFDSFDSFEEISEPVLDDDHAASPLAEVAAFPQASDDAPVRKGSGDIYAALTPERLDQESSPLEPIPGMPDLDEERTSLLRFLSSVKP